MTETWVDGADPLRGNDDHYVSSPVDHLLISSLLKKMPYFVKLDMRNALMCKFYEHVKTSECYSTVKLLDPESDWMQSDRERSFYWTYLESSLLYKTRETSLVGPFRSTDELDGLIVYIANIMMKFSKATKMLPKLETRILRRRLKKSFIKNANMKETRWWYPDPRAVPARRLNNNFHFFQDARAGCATWIGPIAYRTDLFVVRVELKFDPVRVAVVRDDAFRLVGTSLEAVATPLEIADFIRTMSSVSGRLMPERDVPTALASARPTLLLAYSQSIAAEAASLVHQAEQLKLRIDRMVAKGIRSYLEKEVRVLQKVILRRSRSVIRECAR